MHFISTRFFQSPGPQRVAREKMFWSTIWTTKNCTRKDPSGARFGAQKVARKKADLEHDMDHKKLHATKPIWSTEDSLEWAAASEELKARRTAGFAQVQDTSGVLFFSRERLSAGFFQ